MLGEGGAQDLVAHAASLQEDFRALRDSMDDMAAALDRRMVTAEDRLDGAIAFRALVRYDAYNEMSGHQSTSIALLDARRDGVVLSSIHHREQARLYAKQVRDGRSEIELSPEEPRRSLGLEGDRAGAASRPADAGRLPRAPGTFSRRGPDGRGGGREPRAGGLPTLHDAIMAVHDGSVDRAFVPIENSIEGSVNATLDTLAEETEACASSARSSTACATA